jgi:hypothetical protein
MYSSNICSKAASGEGVAAAGAGTLRRVSAAGARVAATAAGAMAEAAPADRIQEIAQRTLCPHAPCGEEIRYLFW